MTRLPTNPVSARLRRAASIRERWRDRRFNRQRRCNHERQRCVHGDEIIAVGYRRARCLDCGKYLPDLPEMCSVTGAPHG